MHKTQPQDTCMTYSDWLLSCLIFWYYRSLTGSIVFSTFWFDVCVEVNHHKYLIFVNDFMLFLYQYSACSAFNKLSGELIRALFEHQT